MIINATNISNGISSLNRYALLVTKWTIYGDALSVLLRHMTNVQHFPSMLSIWLVIQGGSSVGNIIQTGVWRRRSFSSIVHQCNLLVLQWNLSLPLFSYDLWVMTMWQLCPWTCGNWNKVSFHVTLGPTKSMAVCGKNMK